MILDFSIQNFNSVKEKQTLSFIADRSTHLEDYYIISVGKYRILKLNLLYGANASGKTNILKALDFLRDLIIDPAEKKTDIIDFEPFLLDSNSPQENSYLCINFLQDKIRYFYEVTFNQKCIISEGLYYYPQKVNVFRRTTDIEKQLAKITFNTSLNVDTVVVKTLESNTLWNNTVLGGALKTNIDQQQVKNATDWFTNYLMPVITPRTELDNYIKRKIRNSDVNKNLLIEILRKADFDISDILLKEEEHNIPEGFLEFLEKSEDVSKEKIKELKNAGKLKSVNIRLEHTVEGKKYNNIPLELESLGTQRYFGLGGILITLIKKAGCIPIDELEASLHPDLFIHFILSFLVNSKQSQLIATTHNREILNNREIFRNDAIWFTNKSKTSTTELYSLSDFDSSLIRDTRNILNAYKVGKFGAIPNLGDYYIDDEKE